MSFLRKAQDVADKVTAFARAVAAKRAAVVGLVAVGLSQLVTHHVITPDVSNSVNSWILWAFGAAAFVGGITWIHLGVTPADPAKQPVSTNGVQLVEATVAAQAAHAAYQAGAASTDPELAQLDQAAAVMLDDPPSAVAPPA